MAKKAPGAYSSEVNRGSSVSSKNKNVTVILGTATNGPLEPTEIFSKPYAEKIFGPEISSNYGLIALNKIIDNAESIIYCRICHKGDKAYFSATDTKVFEAKEGGTMLNGTTLTVDFNRPSNVATFKFTKSETVIDEVTVSIDTLSSDYIANSFNSKSEYFNYVGGDAFEIDLETASFVLTPGTEGAKVPTSSGDIVVHGKYYGSFLNGATFRITSSLDGKFSAILSKGGSLLESIPAGPAGETFEDFKNRVNTLSEYVDVVSGTTLKNCVITLSGGDSGLEVNADDYIGTQSEGLKALADTSQLQVTTLIIPGVSDSKVIAYAQNLANSRQDFLYIPDPPIGLKAYQTKSWVEATGLFSNSTKLDSSYLGVFSPWVKSTDGIGNSIYLPPSVVVANAICTNDQTNNLWDAIAGYKRGVLSGVDGLEYNPTTDDINILYNNSYVNPIIYVKDKGYVIWGNKTCKTAKNPNNPEPSCSLNVRRLVNHIKYIVQTIAMNSVFEINDEFTWNQFKLQVEPKLRAIKEARGLYDYQVIMDETTVTPDKIDSLEMPGIIRLQPSRTAEVITLGFELYPAGVTFDDTI